MSVACGLTSVCMCMCMCVCSFYRGVVWAALTAAYYVANGDVETFPPAALTCVLIAAASCVVARHTTDAPHAMVVGALVQ